MIDKEDKKVLQKEFEKNGYKFNEELYEKIKKTVNENNRYEEDGKIIKGIIEKFPNNTDLTKDNTDLTEVYAKVVIINTTHSTNLRANECLEASKIIFEFNNFDERLKKTDTSMVDELIEKQFNISKKRHQWSFFTKYLACHNPEFSKYDRYVGDYVEKRSKELGLPIFKRSCGKFYENYHNAITKIMEEYGFIGSRRKDDLENENDRQLFDYFIWGLYRE